MWLAWLLAGGARAQSAVCLEPRIHIEGELGIAWIEPVTRVCQEFSTMANLDPSVQLRILAAGDDVTLEAFASDGRAATRRVHDPGDLRHKIEALVCLPAARADLEPASPPAQPPAASSPAAAVPLSAAAPAAAAPAIPAPPLGIEIGSSLIGHVSRAPTYASGGLGVHAGIRPGAWLLALALRWEPLQEVLTRARRPVGFEMDSLGAGFMISRRLWRAEPVDVDLGVSSFLMAESQSFTEANAEKTGSAADVRVGLFSRMLIGPSAWRWTLSIEADLSPLRLRRDLHIDPSLPKLPTWSLGLGLGAAWSES
jgi:hypothetical protein